MRPLGCGGSVVQPREVPRNGCPGQVIKVRGGLQVALDGLSMLLLGIMRRSPIWVVRARVISWQVSGGRPTSGLSLPAHVCDSSGGRPVGLSTSCKFQEFVEVAPRGLSTSCVWPFGRAVLRPVWVFRPPVKAA